MPDRSDCLHLKSANNGHRQIRLTEVFATPAGLGCCYPACFWWPILQTTDHHQFCPAPKAKSGRRHLLAQLGVDSKGICHQPVLPKTVIHGFSTALPLLTIPAAAPQRGSTENRSPSSDAQNRPGGGTTGTFGRSWLSTRCAQSVDGFCGKPGEKGPATGCCQPKSFGCLELRVIHRANRAVHSGGQTSLASHRCGKVCGWGRPDHGCPQALSTGLRFCLEACDRSKRQTEGFLSTAAASC